MQQFGCEPSRRCYVQHIIHNATSDSHRLSSCAVTTLQGMTAVDILHLLFRLPSPRMKYSFSRVDNTMRYCCVTCAGKWDWDRQTDRQSSKYTLHPVIDGEALRHLFASLRFMYFGYDGTDAADDPSSSPVYSRHCIPSYSSVCTETLPALITDASILSRTTCYSMYPSSTSSMYTLSMNSVHNYAPEEEQHLQRLRVSKTALL